MKITKGQLALLGQDDKPPDPVTTYRSTVYRTKETHDPHLSPASEPVEEAFETIPRHVVSFGSWSIVSLLQHLIAAAGPCHLTTAVWSLESDAGEELAEEARAGNLLSFRALFDPKYRVNADPALRDICAAVSFADVRLGKCHSKAFLLHNDRFRFSVESTANFRAESTKIDIFTVSDDPGLFEFHLGWIEEALAEGEEFEFIWGVDHEDQ
jgi:hypothetical protein